MTSGKVQIDMKNKYERIVVLVDMDCFYCQVEEKLTPSLQGKPIAVVQYNAWQGGGIIAVNYPARAQGVTRHMRGNQAKEQCPDIELVSVPSVREKADLTKYREAGKSVADVLQLFTPLLERASVDEAYLDITEQVNSRLDLMNKGTYKIKPVELFNTFAIGYESFANFLSEITAKYGKQYDIEDELEEFEYNDEDIPAIKKSSLKLLIGASITNEIRAQVKEKTGYDCSAGIAHNKILAKLACGMNKPNKQTVFPLKKIPELFRSLPIGKIKGLGGKFGEEVCETLQVKNLGEITEIEENELKKKFDEKSGTWLYLIARGIDLEAVTPRYYSKSIGCCKKFPGRNSLNGLKSLNHWLNELASEIGDRLEKDLLENNRKAKQIVLSFIQEINSVDVSLSRSSNLISYDPETIAKIGLEVLQNNTEVFLKKNSESVLNNPIKFLGISVGKFETLQSNQNTLKQMFLKQNEEQATKKMENNFRKKVDVNKEVDDSENSEIEEELTIQNVDVQQLLNDKVINITETENIAEANVASNLVLQTQKKRKQAEIKEIEKHEEIIPTLEDQKKKSFFLNLQKNTSEIENTQLDEIISDAIEIKDKCQNENDKLDYTKTYAELMQPETISNDFVICTQCKQKVLSYDLQSHLDGHLAFQLSQQQRIEYRNELKNSHTPPSKKVKPNNNVNNGNKVKQKQKSLENISKFFKKCEKKIEMKPNENEFLCPQCNCLVEKIKKHEHEDLHLAQKIQKEWNLTNSATTSEQISDRLPSTSKLSTQKFD